MQLIHAAHLQKYFGSTCAVDDLTLNVASGEIYGLVGPDGAGKTTTLRLLCGALTPDARPGEGKTEKPKIQIGGIDLLQHTEQARSHIGYMAQRFSLYEDLTVLENLRFYAEVRGLPPTEWRPRCMEILAFVGLAEFSNRRAGQLSGGMKQKLGLAAALVHRPRILLLDEPTTGVDPVTRQDFWQLIIRLAAESGVAVLVSTPYMDEAARCHRVGFMRQGKLLVESTPRELQSRLEGQIIELRGHPLPLLCRIANRLEEVEDATMFGDRVHLRVSPGSGDRVIDRLETAIPAAGGTITHLQATPALLEDVFIALLEVQA
jgi:ABC-2 type transport system ATP-binding protein